MKYKFISKIHLLDFKETMNKGIQIHEDIRLSNSKTKIIEEFSDDFFKDMIGTLEHDALSESSYLYALGEINEEHFTQEPIHYLDSYLRIAQIFCSSLWLLKDNSVNNETGFLYLLQAGGKPFSVSSNMRTPIFTNASGKLQDTIFNRNEINEVVGFINTFFKNEHSERKEGEMYKYLNNEASRVERFFYFLQAARTQSNLPSRIAMYCTMLETLLSTDTTEITHKIAERTARFIGTDFNERNILYKSVKEAYAIRSSTVHGDKLRKSYRSEEKLQEISVNIDEILRRIIIKIIKDREYSYIFHTSDNEKLNEWFTRLTLE